ncbi:MAG: methyltransferase [Sandaracinaceae bacterium]|nr:methyltransferase [Sandaracinaceae bacterium]
MSVRPDIAAVFPRVLGLLRETEDVVVERPAGGSHPAWAQRRGWADWLLSLSDEQVHEAEHDPAGWLAGQRCAPASLRALAAGAADVSAPWGEGRDPSARTLERHVKRRKQVQLDAFAGVAQRQFAGVTRVVDLGAGHGHLTRALARALRPEETLGVDWNQARVARAIDLAGVEGPRFVHADGSDGDGLTLRPHDLVVGLHPCGDLGDALVSRARDARAHVLAVSCCFQETAAAARGALSAEGKTAGFTVPKRALGLANLAPVSFEGSGSLADKRAWRESRLALRLLLEARGLYVEPGAEAQGVPKDRLRQGLEVVVALSLAARGLPPATAAEVAAASTRAARAHAVDARMALPRHALARVLELAIVLDRARLLDESGWRTEVVPLFSARTSPRNLAIVAAAPG